MTRARLSSSMVFLVISLMARITFASLYFPQSHIYLLRDFIYVVFLSYPIGFGMRSL